MKLKVVGVLAYDSITSEFGTKENIFGGSATYFGIASSYYTKTNLIGIVGTDFSDEEWKLFTKHNINIESVDVVSGKTFSWGGEYNFDYSKRETLFTELGVFENFQPNIINNDKNSILYLGNIQPHLQFQVIEKIDKHYLIDPDKINL